MGPRGYMSSGLQFERALTINFEKADLIERINKEGFTPELKRRVKIICSKPNKYIDIIMREDRRKAGLRSYRDSKGKTRLCETNELEKDYLERKWAERDEKQKKKKTNKEV